MALTLCIVVRFYRIMYVGLHTLCYVRTSTTRILYSSKIAIHNYQCSVNLPSFVATVNALRHFYRSVSHLSVSYTHLTLPTIYSV